MPVDYQTSAYPTMQSIPELGGSGMGPTGGSLNPEAATGAQNPILQAMKTVTAVVMKNNNPQQKKSLAELMQSMISGGGNPNPAPTAPAQPAQPAAPQGQGAQVPQAQQQGLRQMGQSPNQRSMNQPGAGQRSMNPQNKQPVIF